MRKEIKDRYCRTFTCQEKDRVPDLEFGMDLRLRGGIAKDPLVKGGKAIDKELERIRPLLEQGGYIPHLDHLVPPNVPYRNCC